MLEPVFSGKGLDGALKVCVLNDEQYHPFDPSEYLREYHWELYNLTRLNSVSVVRELVQRDFDVFLNICDASWDDVYPGPEVIKALEQAEVAFTGADSYFYDPSREAMKRVCRHHGISTPESVEAFSSADIDRAAQTLRYPLIVKSLNSFGSVGIERQSRVETAAALYEQARRIIQEFGGALIEEFIDGREFTVLVVENPDDQLRPKVYRPIEYIFPPGESFKHYEMKWFLYDQLKHIHCSDPNLEARVIQAARGLFVGLNGVSYGRCDIRVNPEGEVFLLEINANCGLFYSLEDPGSADLVLMMDPEGHSGFLKRIFTAAIKRKQRLRSKWIVRFTPEQGYALYARQPIAAGEGILSFEGRPQSLVSLDHVLHNWEPEQQELFDRHAYPLTDQTFVMPSQQPAEWTPINHSCDPNAWWSGLDITARRPIAEHEQITLDYATFYNERMPDFYCTCDSPSCRKIIRGFDYLEPFVDRYAGHVSDYVRQKRLANRYLDLAPVGILT